MSTTSSTTENVRSTTTSLPTSTSANVPTSAMSSAIPSSTSYPTSSSKSIFTIPDNLTMENNQLFRIIYWVDPLTSGLIFGCILLFSLVITVQDISTISLISYLVVLQIVICFIYVNGVKIWYRFQGQELPPDRFYSQVETLREQTTRDQILILLRPTAEMLNMLITNAVDIMRCADNTRTIMVAIFFLIVGWVAKRVSAIAILVVFSTILFTFPLIYSKKYTQVDKYIALSIKTTSNLVQQIPFLGRSWKKGSVDVNTKKEQ